MSPMNLRGLASLALPLLLIGVGASGCSQSDTPAAGQPRPSASEARPSEARPEAARPSETSQASGEVAPFDLGRTKHSFAKTDDGGVQSVVVVDSADTKQVSLVRAHLAEIRDGLAEGDFGEPIDERGFDIPGVAELTQGAAELDLTYHDIDGGGEITYRSANPALVQALHAWFDAQSSDHGGGASGE